MISLPYDVLHHVVTRASPSSYVALCRTTRDLHAVTTPLLFRKIDLDHHQDHQAEQLLNVLMCSGSLARHVISFSAPAIWKVAAHKVCAVLRKMLRLQHLDFSGFDAVLEHHMDDVVDILKQLKELKSVRCGWIDHDVVIDRMLDALPPLERLSIDAEGHYMPSLDRLLLRSIGRLEYLSPQDYGLDVFLTRSEAIGRVWSCVRELEFCTRSPSLAHAFRNVTRLVISPNSPEDDRLLCDPTLFPHLEQLTMPLWWALPRITLRQGRTRTLPHLKLDFRIAMPFPAANYLDFMRCFDWQSLRTLCLGMPYLAAQDAVLGALPSLLEHCISLRYFGLDSGRDLEDQRDATEIISTLHGCILKARQIRFVNVQMKVMCRDMDGNRDRDAVRAHLAHCITSSFDDLESLRVVQVMVSSLPEEVYWTWTRGRDSPEAATTVERVNFRAVPVDWMSGHRGRDVLPLPEESLSAIVDMIDTA